MSGLADSTASRALAALANINHWCLRVPTWIFVVLLCLAAVLKSGALFLPLLPEPELAAPGSWLYLRFNVAPDILISFMRLIGVGSFTGYEFVSAFLVVMSLVALVLLAKFATQDREQGRTVSIVLILGPIGATILGHFGANDLPFLLGAAAVALGRRKLTWVLPGVLLMVASNPGNALAASVCFAPLVLIPQLKQYRRTALILAGAAVTSYILVAIRARIVGGPTHADWALEHIQLSIGYKVDTLPLLVYSMFGFLALIALWVLLDLQWRDRALVTLALLVLPLAISTPFTDGTRHLVNLTSIPLLVLIYSYLPSIQQQLRVGGRSILLAVTVLVALALPSVHVFGGDVRLPYEYIADRIQFYAQTLI